MKQIRIIHILDHPPAYTQYANQTRPKHNWDTEIGTWVGIWGYDWADSIGIQIMKFNSNVSYEVWQPDYRADKIYSAQLEFGLIHKNFPAKAKSSYLGLKSRQYAFSSSILSELNKIANQNELIKNTLVICSVQLNPFNEKIFYSGLTVANIDLGFPEKYFGNWGQTLVPWKALHRFLVKQSKKAFLKSVNHVIICDYLPKGKNFYEKYISGSVFSSLIGIDLDFYKLTSKIEARNELNIGLNHILFFSNSRLNDLKQIDKLIEAFSGLDHFDFKLIISGHGTREYEDYLRRIISKLGLSNNVILTGYISDHDLVLYYSASDYFMNTSSFDGGPMSAWKALAMGLPVINTNVGNVCNYLLENRVGLIIDKDNSKTWNYALENILSGKLVVKKANTENVRSLLNWETISQKYYTIFQAILNK